MGGIGTAGLQVHSPANPACLLRGLTIILHKRMLKLMSNSLKSSIEANTYVIPGEDAGQLQEVIESYRDKYEPFHAFEWFLVDGMISADWELRRLRMVETQLWQQGLAEGASLSDVFTKSLTLQRHKLATQRSYFRFRKEMLQILQEEDEAIKEMVRSDLLPEEEPEPGGVQDPEAGPGSPADGDSQAPPSELGSFLPKDVAREAPGPELGSFLPKDVVGEAPAPELGSFLPGDVAGEAPACPKIGFVPTRRCRRRGARVSLIGIRRLAARTTRHSGRRARPVASGCPVPGWLHRPAPGCGRPCARSRSGEK
jgi:hypothetical protein